MAPPTQPPTDPGVSIGFARQREIYLAGRAPVVPVDPAALRAAAEAVLPEQNFAYLDCGAGTGSTIIENRAALDRWRLP